MTDVQQHGRRLSPISVGSWHSLVCLVLRGTSGCFDSSGESLRGLLRKTQRLNGRRSVVI
jgi:hypothetical protein